jgi:hypothetical protein
MDDQVGNFELRRLDEREEYDDLAARIAELTLGAEEAYVAGRHLGWRDGPGI